MALEMTQNMGGSSGWLLGTSHMVGSPDGVTLYPRFGLVLMLTHACNLRCTYCYTGAKFGRPMPEHLGRRAIDRALASLEPGGTLELGFFGGEPLLAAGLLSGLLAYARERAAEQDACLRTGLTTNGTIGTAEAWRILLDPEVDVAVSHDGLPCEHNRHRQWECGCGTSARVLRTVKRLVRSGEDFRVVMVVRPDTVDMLPAGIQFLRSLGVRQMEPSLDLWTRWSSDDVLALEDAVQRCAAIWRGGLPDRGISWVDEKAARLAGVPTGETARCAFGSGEVAVAPSGALYPCERLIGEDTACNPMRLPGCVPDGDDFLALGPASPCTRPACKVCSVADLCNTDCRCSNYVRTGDPARPDGLLCALNRSCMEATARVIGAADAEDEA